MTKTIPKIILHLPHSSTVIPAEIRASMLISDEALKQELLRMTDSFTDELFTISPSLATPIIFPASRLVVDVERFLDDSLEPMASRGMGCVYTRTSDGQVLRENDANERSRLLAEYYCSHHQRLTSSVQAALDRWGACVIIDCHSFSSTPLPHEPDQAQGRPEICLGRSPTNTPDDLLERAYAAFSEAAFSVEVDRPFEGSIVPVEFVNDRRVSTIMIEINRGQYLNEKTGQRLPIFAQFCKHFQQALTTFIRDSNVR